MSDLIKVQSMDGSAIRTEAIEFTGYDENYKEIEKWSDGRLAVKGIKISPLRREIEIVMVEQYLRFPVGTYFVKLGGMIIPMSKGVFEKRFALVIDSDHSKLKNTNTVTPRELEQRFEVYHITDESDATIIEIFLKSTTTHDEALNYMKSSKCIHYDTMIIKTVYKVK